MAKVRMSFTLSEDCKKEIARGAELLGVSASEYIEICVVDRLRSTEGQSLEELIYDTAKTTGWWRSKRRNGAAACAQIASDEEVEHDQEDLQEDIT